jgi:glycosyltransferase involved in cell wall biosynthesis
MAKRVLMIAFHYPPCGTSSGLQRTLAFTRYLPSYGWEPALVTASPRAYETVSDAQLSSIPADMPMSRALALDAMRHLSIGGHYPSFLALPDRYSSWRYAGVLSALRLVRRFKPDVIWSTYPIATAHAIASVVARRTGIPWIADMRDPMVEYDEVSGRHFPPDQRIRAARLRIEEDVVRHAHVVFCTHGAKDICLRRYAQRHSVRCSVIENGYDEAAFAECDGRRSSQSRRASDGFRLLHSGTVYPGTDRGPEALLEALRQLENSQSLPQGFRLVMRAPGHEKYLRELIERANVSHLVELAPPLAYQSALAEMFDSDALLVLQGRTSNPAIPAKVYEYLRTRKPLLALVHPAGDTARLLRELDAAVLGPLDDAAAITGVLRDFLERIAAGTAPVIAPAALPRFSRELQTGELAEALTRAMATGATTER